MTVYTIGHSTHPIDEFIPILQAHGIEILVDIRTIPKSRRNPQFNSDALAASLQQACIKYRHMRGLGGLRHPRPDSRNTAWRNDSFRGYADYMETAEFARSLQGLIEVAGHARTAIMCAEAVEWRCHRSLVSDALTVRGIEVEHIHSSARARPHKLTPFAHVNGTAIAYPGIV